MSSDELKTKVSPLPFESTLPPVDCTTPTIDWVDDYGDEPGVGAGVILWPLLVAAICGAILMWHG